MPVMAADTNFSPRLSIRRLEELSNTNVKLLHGKRCPQGKIWIVVSMGRHNIYDFFLIALMHKLIPVSRLSYHQYMVTCGIAISVLRHIITNRALVID